MSDRISGKPQWAVSERVEVITERLTTTWLRTIPITEKSVFHGLGQFVLFAPPTPELSMELVEALVVLVRIWTSPYVLRLGL